MQTLSLLLLQPGAISAAFQIREGATPLATTVGFVPLSNSFIKRYLSFLIMPQTLAWAFGGSPFQELAALLTHIEILSHLLQSKSNTFFFF